MTFLGSHIPFIATRDRVARANLFSGGKRDIPRLTYQDDLLPEGLKVSHARDRLSAAAGLCQDLDRLQLPLGGHLNIAGV